MHRGGRNGGLGGAAWLALGATMAIAALWGRSYRVGESFDFDGRGQKVSVGTQRGSVYVERVASTARNGRSAMRLTFSRGGGYHADPVTPANPTGAIATVRPLWSFAGFAYTDGRVEDLAVQELVVPYWFLAGGAAVIAAAFAERASRKPPPGFCVACGYNLTGNVSGTCPECGIAAHALVPSPPGTPGGVG